MTPCAPATTPGRCCTGRRPLRWRCAGRPGTPPPQRSPAGAAAAGGRGRRAPRPVGRRRRAAAAPRRARPGLAGRPDRGAAGSRPPPGRGARSPADRARVRFGRPAAGRPRTAPANQPQRGRRQYDGQRVAVPACRHRPANRRGARRSVRGRPRPVGAAAGMLGRRARPAPWPPALLRAGRRTVADLAAAGWLAPSVDAQLLVARTALALGRPETARRDLAAVGSRRRRGPADLRARAGHGEALLRLAAGDRRGAIRALQAGLRVLDALRATLGATELRAAVSYHGTDLAKTGLAMALASRQPAGVLLWSERWRASALRARPVRPPDDAELTGLLAELRRLGAAVDDAGRAGHGPRPLLHRQATVEVAVCRAARHTAPSTVACRCSSGRGSGPARTASSTAAPRRRSSASPCQARARRSAGPWRRREPTAARSRRAVSGRPSASAVRATSSWASTDCDSQPAAARSATVRRPARSSAGVQAPSCQPARSKT